MDGCAAAFDRELAATLESGVPHLVSQSPASLLEAGRDALAGPAAGAGYGKVLEQGTGGQDFEHLFSVRRIRSRAAVYRPP